MMEFINGYFGIYSEVLGGWINWDLSTIVLNEIKAHNKAIREIAVNPENTSEVLWRIRCYTERAPWVSWQYLDERERILNFKFDLSEKRREIVAIRDELEFEIKTYFRVVHNLENIRW